MVTRRSRVVSPYPHPILPRPENIHSLQVNDVLFQYKGPGTYLIVCPSLAAIGAKELLKMASDKQELVRLNSGDYVKRTDLLSATSEALFRAARDVETPQEPPRKYRVKNNSRPRSPNSYILYRKAYQKRIREAFPEYNFAEISKLTGAMWSAASKETKAKYAYEAVQHQARAEMEMSTGTGGSGNEEKEATIVDEDHDISVTAQPACNVADDPKQQLDRIIQEILEQHPEIHTMHLNSPASPTSLPSTQLSTTNSTYSSGSDPALDPLLELYPDLWLESMDILSNVGNSLLDNDNQFPVAPWSDFVE